MPRASFTPARSRSGRSRHGQREKFGCLRLLRPTRVNASVPFQGNKAIVDYDPDANPNNVGNRLS
jgi:hypothetical protein